MSGKRDTSWIRILDDAIGLIVIVVAIVAILELAFSFVYALVIFSVGLLAIGIAWVVMGIYVVRANIFARVFMLVTGIATIAISIIDFIFFSLSPDLLIYYPALAMLLVGFSRLVLGFLLGDVPLWIQMLQILAGILTINLAAFVFIFSNINFAAMLILLIISLIANGLVRLIVSRTDVKQKIMQPTDDVSTSG
jgi:uncharacterized membrane protein HdeD (DUF308 family)